MTTHVAIFPKIIGPLVMAVLLFSSCTKEDLLAPNCHEDNNAVVTKSAPAPSFAETTKPVTRLKDGEPTGDGGPNTAISDDGDDLSGSEGRKPNN